MKKYIVLCLSFLVVFSCTNIDDPTSQIKETHVIFIGLDGWGGYNLDRTLSYMPNVRQYTKEGIYTDQKQSVSPSVSSVNWASIFMGTTPEVHGYLSWDSRAPVEPYSFEIKNNIFPTISQVLKNEKNSSEIGMFCQWEGIKYFVDTLSIDYNKYIPITDSSGHGLFTDSVSNYLKVYKPTLCTIVFDDPDHTGHGYGYFTDKYYSVLEELDNCIGRIVQSVKEAGYYDDTVFIITSDHGGIGNNHGGDTPEEKQTCFVMWGKGIKPIGYVNDNLEQQDVAVIMANILGVNIPSLWTGKPHENYFK